MSDNSAAEISVDGVALGKSPVTYNESLAGKDSTYIVEAKYPDGRKVAQEVKRSEMSMNGVGAGAGAGAGGCLALSCVGGIAGAFIGIFAAPVGCLACAALVAGPGAAYFLAGQSPDVVTISPDGKPAGAPPPAVGVVPKRDAAQVATAW